MCFLFFQLALTQARFFARFLCFCPLQGGSKRAESGRNDFFTSKLIENCLFVVVRTDFPKSLLVLDEPVDVVLRAVLGRRHLEHVGHAQQRLVRVAVGDHLEQTQGVHVRDVDSRRNMAMVELDDLAAVALVLAWPH